MPVHPAEATWFLRQLKHTKGRYAGVPFRLQTFQGQMVRDIAALKGGPSLAEYHRGLAEGKRYERLIREALVGVSRKNGKTEIFAGLGLVFLVLDREPGGEVIGAAAKRDQARLLLNAARRMVQTSAIGGLPLDAERGGPLKVYRDAIYFAELDAVFKVVSSDAQREHGANPHVVLGDELHAWADPELWYALTTAQGARDNPLAIAISTGGKLPMGLCHDLYKAGREAEVSGVHDPEVYFSWYEGDPALDLWVPEQRKLYLQQANPGYGTIVSPDYLERQWRRVVAGKLPEYVYRRLHGNQWTTASERWLPYAKWRLCGPKAVAVPQDADVFLGVDAALSRDTFAVALVWLDEATGEVHYVGRAFVPEVDGAYIDPLDVLLYIVGIAGLYHVKKVRADPAYLGILAALLSDKGLDVELWAQTDAHMVRAAETFQRVVLDEKLRTGGDTDLDEQLAATATRMTERGVRIVKSKSGGHVDLVVALAMALDALFNPEEGEGRDFAHYSDDDSVPGLAEAEAWLASLEENAA